jgi:formate hydrogenlyase subunit 6/NADH:ubiquinone oxidoreductase subunit I
MAENDLSRFDHLTDRVARARAKAEAMRKAKEGTAEQEESSFSAASQADALVEGKSEGSRTTPSNTENGSGLPLLEFYSGTCFTWRGRTGRIVDVRYDTVRFVYDDDPGQTFVSDRLRLSYAHAEGLFDFAPKPEAYRPERVGKACRVDHHDYVWLETRKGMTVKKKRPRSIAIVNPDYCTGCNACIEVCPTDCIEEVDVSDARLEGIGHFCDVRLSDCIGCAQCVTMCPWDAIEMVETQRVEEAYDIPVGSL